MQRHALTPSPGSRGAGALLPSILFLLCAARSAAAVDRQVYKEVRARHEGMSYRLRIDLDQAQGANDPNVVSLQGVGHAREKGRVLFGQLETVFVERVINAGGSRLELSVYGSKEDAQRLRASNIPQPGYPGSSYGRTIGSFAQLGSTSILFEVGSGKKEPAAQAEEIETLLDRVFYLGSGPTPEELEAFVRQHAGLPLQRLRELTGLDSETVRRLIKAAAAAAAEASPPH
ncbi:MAG TPA: hypothetical protein VGA64_07595 [Candidatus Polarisedimenticolia bacterium]